MALKTLGKDIPNTSMLGGLVKVTRSVGMDSLKSVLAQRFRGTVLEQNLNALESGFEGVVGPS